MWTSNSVIAWLIAGVGLATDHLGPPPRGRAPGWSAGLVVARRPAGHTEEHRRPVVQRDAIDAEGGRVSGER